MEKPIEKLPPYRINEDGALAEWAHTDFKDNYNHRHVSHLYPLWPGHEINPGKAPDLFKAASIPAHKRGRGNGSAHGLAHMALIASRLKDAELVYGNLNFMLRNDYLLPSLFTFHNPNKIYNADMLLCLRTVVMEMLIYSRPGEIELIPALSDKFPTGFISGVKCRGRITVDQLKWDLPDKQIDLILTSAINQDITLRLRRGINAVDENIINAQTTTLKLKKNKPTKLLIKLF